MFTEPMGNMYSLNMGLILGEQFNYLIDTGLGSGSIEAVTDYLKDDNKPTIVINTHHHWDHVWGNHIFRDSIIISHKLCHTLLEEYWDDMVEENRSFIDGIVERCLPNLTFLDSLFFPKDNVEIFYTPGHSIDCISVYDKIDKVLYAGDNIGDTNDVIVQYIDTDIELFKKTLMIYSSYDFDVCVSGHNNPQGKDIVFRMEKNLLSCWERQNEKLQ